MTDGDTPAARQDTSGDRTLAVINYILILLGVPSSGILLLIALILAYIRLDQSQGWLRTHFIYQIRTIWGGLLFVVVGWATIWILGLGLLVWLFGAVWVLVRGAVGLVRLVDGREHPDPRAFLF
ncbi:hypothetical protein DDZ18_07970 [Marinicauda salina]|jgi:uncharacterized membrane protein|uniref:DUF4870 domain-containing protein n=1 Tax=Marinicauda salina TaxID=2135793 RepID=A0A2U2BUA5_9PROT|nr:hypothetical protein [Marinicauda salina]PWE17593.1 hypothetical protein DDZ18_07970 [Marinicauda salina]